MTPPLLGGGARRFVGREVEWTVFVGLMWSGVCCGVESDVRCGGVKSGVASGVCCGVESDVWCGGVKSGVASGVKSGELKSGEVKSGKWVVGSEEWEVGCGK